MLIAFTTVASEADAQRLADAVIAAHLAACVQIDGPIRSVYRWQERIERATEFRLTFKCLPAQLAALETLVLAEHPYDTPEWLVLRAERVGEKYLSWARSDSTHPPL